MPNLRAARKSLRQSERRREKNLAVKRNIKKQIKEFGGLLSAGKTDDAKQKLPTVFKVLDKAAKNRVIDKNKSSRLKSRLSVRLNKSSATSGE